MSVRITRSTKSQQSSTKSQQSSTKSQHTDMEEALKQINEKLDKVITEDALDIKLKNLLTKEDLKEAFKVVKEEILAEVNKTTEELKATVHDQAVEIDQLKKQVCGLTKKSQNQADIIQGASNVAQVNNLKFNDLEQWTRKSSIRIFGVPDLSPVESSEECTSKVTTILKDKLKMDIEEKDIDIAHRLGKFSNDGNRPVIVKFMSRKHKIAAIQKRSALKGTRVVIREDLTTMNYRLLTSVKAHTNVATVWSRDGNIYAKTHVGKIVHIEHGKLIDSVLSA